MLKTTQKLSRIRRYFPCPSIQMYLLGGLWNLSLSDALNIWRGVYKKEKARKRERETVESPPHVTFWWKTTFGIDKNSLVSPQEQELTQRNQITQLARHRIISNWKNCIQYHWNSIIANFEKE